jgi:S-adenosylmethionine:tRNA ribosyltransferase-isomerase
MTLVGTPDGLAFDLPSGRIATEPAEVRNSGRDDVRLMVATRHDEATDHVTFPAIVDVLRPNDLVVVNVSATLPASLPAARAGGTPLRLHLSTRLSDDLWSIELREPSGDGTLPWRAGVTGEVIDLPDGGRAQLVNPYPSGSAAVGSRLWTARLDLPIPLDLYLATHGGPIRYTRGTQRWPMLAYQTVYASAPGSAEMPSAGRAFTSDILTALASKGVGIAPLVLHAGVSSPDDHEPPYPEWFEVPARTAARVNAARAGRGRIIATGTTVVRALETCAGSDGEVRATTGWTDLVIGAEHPPRVVDGLLTGWHEPGASHLRLLETIAGRPLLERCYQDALAAGYLWHEFGDLLLVLP